MKSNVEIDINRPRNGPNTSTFASLLILIVTMDRNTMSKVKGGECVLVIKAARYKKQTNTRSLQSRSSHFKAPVIQPTDTSRPTC